jgi:hypothetical protein
VRGCDWKVRLYSANPTAKHSPQESQYQPPGPLFSPSPTQSSIRTLAIPRCPRSYILLYNARDRHCRLRLPCPSPLPAHRRGFLTPVSLPAGLSSPAILRSSAAPAEYLTTDLPQHIQDCEKKNSNGIHTIVSHPSPSTRAQRNSSGAGYGTKTQTANQRNRTPKQDIKEHEEGHFEEMMAATTLRNGARLSTDSAQLDVPCIQPTKRPPRSRRKRRIMPSGAWPTVCFALIVASFLPLTNAVRTSGRPTSTSFFIVWGFTSHAEHDVPWRIQGDWLGVCKRPLRICSSHTSPTDDDNLPSAHLVLCLSPIYVLIGRRHSRHYNMIPLLTMILLIGVYQFRKLSATSLSPRCRPISVPSIHPVVRLGLVRHSQSQPPIEHDSVRKCVGTGATWTVSTPHF